jgi:hypothetical protein
MKSLKAILVILILSFFITNVLGVGLSPPQLRITNVPMGEMAKVSTLRIMNTGATATYVILKISCLEPNRLNKLRVICVDENREIGIQRGDLVYPAKIKEIDGKNITVEYKDGTSKNISKQNEMAYAIDDYILIGDAGNIMKKIDNAEASLNKGYCPFCGSSNLIFYDLPPPEILNSIQLSCEEYPLEKMDNTTYHTIERLDAGKTADIDISLNIPDEAQYYGGHWEARVMATSVDNLTAGAFLVYGVETKLLLDTPVLAVKSEPNNVSITMFILVGLGIGGIIAVCLLIHIVHRKRSLPKKTKTPAVAEKKAAPVVLVNKQKETTDDVLEKAHRLLDNLK